jgi:hypothetical protein
MDGFDQMIQPQGGPVPAPVQSTGQPLAPPAPMPANMEARMAGWQQVMEKLKDPHVQRGLLNFSMVAGNAPRVGESDVGQMARGVNAGVAAYDTSLWNATERQMLEEKNAREAAQSESQLKTAEQGRVSSQAQVEETKQRTQFNREDRPLNLDKIRLDLKKAQLITDATERETSMAALKNDFVKALAETQGPVDTSKFNAVEKSWYSELLMNESKLDLMKEQTGYYKDRGDAALLASGPNGKGPTGAQIQFQNYEQVIQDLKLTDPLLLAMPEGPKKDAQARLMALGRTYTQAKPIEAAGNAEQNAATFVANYGMEYGALPEAKRKGMTFAQFVTKNVNDPIKGEMYVSNPTLKAEVLRQIGGAAAGAPTTVTTPQSEQPTPKGTGAVKPLPKTDKELVKGEKYKTGMGTMEWTGTGFIPAATK